MVDVTEGVSNQQTKNERKQKKKRKGEYYMKGSEDIWARYMKNNKKNHGVGASKRV